MRRGAAAIVILAAWAAAEEESAFTDFERGKRFYDAREYARAEECFRSAAADERCGDAHYFLGLVLERKGDREGSAAQYREVKEEFPTYAFAQDRLGQRALEAGDAKGAAACFEAACKARPSLESWTKLGLVRIDLKAYGEAEEALKKAREFSAGDLTLQDAFARLYLETERFEEALGCAETILKAVPKDASARFLKGVCRERLGRVAEAASAYEETLQVDAAHKGAMQRLIGLYEKDPARAKEVADLRKRLDFVTKHPPRIRPAPPQ